MSISSQWYSIQNIDELDSPALAVYPERIEENIRRMIQIAGNAKRLRPHVKTHKMEEVVRMQLKNGISKFKCATIAEAEMLGNTGIQDVLLAYQPVGPKVHRLAQLTEKFPQTNFSTLIDDVSSTQLLAKKFEQAGKSIQVYLDIDVGMHRTGILPDEKALELYLLCLKLEGIHPVGLHVYDGHHHDPDWETRKRRCDKTYGYAKKLAGQIEKITEKFPVIIAGGTPTFPVHALRPEVECSPGTCLLWDWGYHSKLPDLDFLFAALVISRIISKPGNKWLCTDLGHKSIAAENPFPRVHWLNLPKASVVSQSEEHLVLEVDDNSKYDLGTVLYGIPFHICPTSALYERALVVENKKVNAEWGISARDRKISI